MTNQSEHALESNQINQDTRGDRNQTVGQVHGGIVVYVSGGQAIINPIDVVTAESAKPGSQTLGPNPYKGLLAFNENDGDRYFGRSYEIQHLWDKFRALYGTDGKTRLLPIYGPSGSGKSSLARAGLLPELGRRPLPGCEKARVAVLVPGNDPLYSLAVVLAKIATEDPNPVEKADEFKRVLKKSEDSGEFNGLNRIAFGLPEISTSPLIILIDQFEEIYSYEPRGNSPDDLRKREKFVEERNAFIENILFAARNPSQYVSVIITFRSDFLGETHKHQRLNQLFSLQGFLVPIMRDEDLEKAIAEPAKQAGYTLDIASVELLIRETQGRDGALPLLQVALTKIWEHLPEKEPAQTLAEIKGVGGALAGEAERIYSLLSTQDQAIAKRVFLRLVQLGEGTRDTRRRVGIKSLIAAQDNPTQVKFVIHEFADREARLLTLSSHNDDEVLEITHEAILDQWERFRSWLDESRDDLRFLRRLEEAATLWNIEGRPEGRLWRPPDLALLDNFAKKYMKDLTELQIQFFLESRKNENSRKWLRRISISSIIALSLFSTISFLVARQNARIAKDSEYEAQVSTIDALAQTASAYRSSGKHLEALITATRLANQIQRQRLPEPRFANLGKSSFYPSLDFVRERLFYHAHAGWVQMVRFSPNGKYLASTGTDGTIKVFNLENFEIVELKGHERGLLRHAGVTVFDMYFSPDNQRLVSAGADGKINIWLPDGSMVASLNDHSSTVYKLAFSPKEKIFASASRDGTVKLWNFDGKLVQTINVHVGYTDGVYDVQFTSSGKQLVSLDQLGRIKVWDIDGTLVKTFGDLDSDFGRIRLSPDGRFIAATFYNQEDIAIMDMTGKVINVFNESKNRVVDFQFSPDSQRIASVDEYGAISIWRIGSDISLINFDSKDYGTTDLIRGLQFNSSGEILLGWGDFVHVWHFADSGVSSISYYDKLTGHTGSILEARFNSDASMIASGGADGTLRLYSPVSSSIPELNLGRGFFPQGAKQNSRFSLENNSGVASNGSKVQAWEFDNSSLSSIFESSDREINAVTLSPNEDMVALVFEDEIRLINKDGGDLHSSFKVKSSARSIVQFSPNNDLLAISNENAVSLWRTDGTSLSVLEISKPINSFSYSPDGTMLAVSYDDGIRLWGVNGDLLATLNTEEGASNVQFNPRGDLIAAVSDDSVNVWKLDGTLASTLEGHNEVIDDLEFSPDGKIVATASRDMTARLWNLEDSTVEILEGRGNPVRTIAFNEDGSLVATGSEAVQIWRTDGSFIAHLGNHEDPVIGISFSSDGEQIITLGEDGVIRSWPWSLDVLVKKSCKWLQQYIMSYSKEGADIKDLCQGSK